MGLSVPQLSEININMFFPPAFPLWVLAAHIALYVWNGLIELPIDGGHNGGWWAILFYVFC